MLTFRATIELGGKTATALGVRAEVNEALVSLSEGKV